VSGMGAWNFEHRVWNLYGLSRKMDDKMMPIKKMNAHGCKICGLKKIMKFCEKSSASKK